MMKRYCKLRMSNLTEKGCKTPIMRSISCCMARLTTGNGGVRLRRVQSEAQATILLQITGSPCCTWSTVVPDVQRVGCLREGPIGVGLLICIDIPDDLCRSARNDTIRRSYSVSVPIIAHCRHCEVRRGCNYGCHIPCKCDWLARSDLVK